MALRWLLLLLFVGIAGSNAPPISDCCRFARLSAFSPQNLVSGTDTLRHQFIHRVMEAESAFGRAAVHIETQVTLDGWPIDYHSGQLFTEMGPHLFSAASKESLHLQMLALALKEVSNNNGYHSNVEELNSRFPASTWLCYAGRVCDAQNASSVVSYVSDVLIKKLTTYEGFQMRYPGFGGFLPWFSVNDTTGNVGLLKGWADRVPSLDNGQLAWGLVAVREATQMVLTDRQRNISTSATASLKIAAARVSAYVDTLRENVVTVFYAGSGQIRAVSVVKDVRLVPNGNLSNYAMPSGSNDYLDDPYEGELMSFFMDLYGVWPPPHSREDIWKYKIKRGMLQRVEYVDPSNSSRLISVQRGWWFSSHEQWKIMVLPYLSVPLIYDIFANCERARLLHSQVLGIPGLYASVSGVVNRTKAAWPSIPEYNSACGITSLAFQRALTADEVTPYGAWPALLFLHQPQEGASRIKSRKFTTTTTAGLAWYSNMLRGPRMQSSAIGSLAGVLCNGSAIAPVGTWDSKVTSVVAICGGTQSLTLAALQKDNLVDRFFAIAHDQLYSPVFSSKPLLGTDIVLDSLLPSQTIPVGPPNGFGPLSPDYSDCTCKGTASLSLAPKNVRSPLDASRHNRAIKRATFKDAIDASQHSQAIERATSREFVRREKHSLGALGAKSETNPKLGDAGNVFSAVIGWIYFIAWSVSFYPQVWLNWKRKSVVGLSFDFEIYNFIGFSAYAVFNCALYFNHDVQDEYRRTHGGNTDLVQLNDVIFALHAVVLTFITIVQIFIYERGGQRVTLLAKILTALLVAGAAIFVGMSAIGWFSWLDFFYFLSYEKLFVTVIKYVPQAYLNFTRKSTVGWNIWNVLLDFTGGTLSIVQLLFDGWRLSDFGGIIGDPVKFFLGFASMVFDVLFITQHYILYRENNMRLEREERQRRVTSVEAIGSVNQSLLAHAGASTTSILNPSADGEDTFF